MKFLWRYKWYIALVLLLGLVAVRAALPVWIQNYVNRKIDEVPEYTGRIGDVDLNLWRGAYEIEDIDISKTSGEVPVPFFSAAKVDFSVQWKALFEGALVGEIDFYRPKINFVKGPTEEQSQVGVDKPWTEKIRELFPLKINHVRAREGEIHYRDFHKTPKVDIVLRDVDLIINNLTNSQDLSETMVADGKSSGKIYDGEVDLEMKIDPYAERPTFDVDGRMTEISLPKLNEFARAYANIDFESGTLTLASEMAASEGKFTGYIKPVFDKMKIVDLEEDSENPLQLVWESIVGGLTRVVRNQPKDRFATKIPFSGSFDDPQAAILPTVANVFKNAFIQALEGDIEGTVDLEDARR